MSKTEMSAREIMDLSTEELLIELTYVNKMCKFYYGRKEEIMKEIERRTENGK